MKYIKTFEDINIPIKIGDVVLGGKFKNRKIIIKKIGKNKKGDITVNDKPLLKYRIIKESLSDEDIKSYLAYLIDDMYNIKITSNTIVINNPIRKNANYFGKLNTNNFILMEWNDIKYDIIPFIESYFNDIYEIYVLVPSSTTDGNNRVMCDKSDIIKNGDLDDFLQFTIIIDTSSINYPIKYVKKFESINESISMKDMKSYLAYLIDDGFTVNLLNEYSKYIVIYKLKSTKYSETVNNLEILNNDKLDMELISFIELFKNEIKYILISYNANGFAPYSDEFYRNQFSPDDIIKDGFTGNFIIKITIIFK